MTLVERTERWIVNGPLEAQDQLLYEAVNARNPEGLFAVQRMFEDMYGDMTYNRYVKFPAGVALLAWGDDGLKAMLESAIGKPTVKNRVYAAQILSELAAGDGVVEIAGTTIQNYQAAKPWLDLVVASNKDPLSFAKVARHALRELVLALEDEDDAVQMIGSQLSHAGLTGMDAAREAFHALAVRWLTVGAPVITAYEQLLVSAADDEPKLQSFFERFPQLLDPAATEIWSQPDIHGAKAPDFVVRRMDDSYLVIEIETPAKPLVTAALQLAAPATHAAAQVIDYREFLVERMQTVRNIFPEFREPDCLVVVGMEAALDEGQRAALARENRARHRTQIVGFDWISRRARSVMGNIIDGRQLVRGARLV